MIEKTNNTNNIEKTVLINSYFFFAYVEPAATPLEALKDTLKRGVELPN